MHYLIIEVIFFSETIDPTDPEDIGSIDSLILSISTLRVATDNFDDSNKLGEGGFGVVYKVLIIPFHFSFYIQ